MTQLSDAPSCARHEGSDYASRISTNKTHNRDKGPDEPSSKVPAWPSPFKE